MRWYDRLRRPGEIAHVRRRGRHAGATSFSLYSLEPSAGRTQVGVTVSKAVGNAVVRNLVRRRILGALDALPERPPARRLLFVAKPAAANEPYARLAGEVAGALAGLRGH